MALLTGADVEACLYSASRYLSQGLFCCHDGINACFRCSCSYLELLLGRYLFFLLRWWRNFVKVTPHFVKLTRGQRARVFVLSYCCSTSAIEDKKLKLQTFYFVLAAKQSLQNISPGFVPVLEILDRQVELYSGIFQDWKVLEKLMQADRNYSQKYVCVCRLQGYK